MPDLHEWITQQIDKVEASTHSATPGPWSADTDDDTVFAAAGTVARMWDYVRSGSDVEVKADMGLIITHADPGAVLRRCAADRKILARHCTDPDRADDRLFATACRGCGTMGDCDDPVTENINGCPELLDLAEGHGLTPGILADLDRPESPPAPPYPGKTGNLIVDSAISLHEQMLAAVDKTITRTLIDGDGTGDMLGFRIVDAPPEPTPAERAFAILEPHLRDIPLFRPKFAYGGILPNGFGATADRAPVLRNCHWKVHL